MILILVLWFILTGNTEMSPFLKKVHSSKGKSKHVDKRRSSFYHSPIISSHTSKRTSWSLKKSHRPKLSRKYDEIQMPYRTFENGNKYKRLMLKPIKKQEYGVLYPMITVATIFGKSRIKIPLYKKYNDSTKRKESIMSSIGNLRLKNRKPINLFIKDNFKPSANPRYSFSFNHEKFSGNFNKDDRYAMHFRNERNQFVSPVASGIRWNFQSNNFITRNEVFQMPLNKYNKPVNHYPREIQTSTINQIIKRPKYLTLPPFLQLKVKSFPDFATSTQQISLLTSKFPYGSLLPDYKLPDTTARFLNFGSVAIQNNMSRQDFSETPEVKEQINEEKYLTPPPYFKFTDTKSFHDFRNTTGEMSLSTSKLPSENGMSPENKQFPINILISNSSLANNFRLPVPDQNNMSIQRNLFKDESNDVKPSLGVLSEVNQQIPSLSGAFSTHQEQSAILNGQNINENIVTNKSFNASFDRMHNQSDQNLDPYNNPPSNTNSTRMISTETSFLQYLHHKLKEIKDIHDRLGSNAKILISSMAAILVAPILILLLRSIYRNNKADKKKRYPIEKKNAFTFLRATRKEQRNLLTTIGYLKYDKLTDEDFEK